MHVEGRVRVQLVAVIAWYPKARSILSQSRVVRASLAIRRVSALADEVTATASCMTTPRCQVTANSLCVCMNNFLDMSAFGFCFDHVFSSVLL